LSTCKKFCRGLFQGTKLEFDREGRATLDVLIQNSEDTFETGMSKFNIYVRIQ